MKRRDFLKALGISSTAAITSSCMEGWHWMGTKSEKLIPFLVPPAEDQIPGESVFLTSGCTECPAQCGTLVKIVVEAPNPSELVKNRDYKTKFLFDVNPEPTLVQSMDEWVIHQDLRKLFEEKKVPLTVKALLRVRKKGTEWVIHNGDYWQNMYLLIVEKNRLQVHGMTKKDWWDKLEKSWYGNPVKLEGNPHHPVNQGKLCIRGQASLSRLYKEDRIKAPMIKVGKEWQEITWKEALQKIGEHLTQKDKKREHLYLSSRITGSLSSFVDQFCEKTGIRRLPEFEVYSHSALRKAYEALYGIGDIPFYNLEESDFLLTLGADLFETFVSPVSYAGQFATLRKKKGFQWIHGEPHISLTGQKAHKRLILQAGSEVYLLSYLLTEWNRQNKEDSRSPRTLLSDDILGLIPHHKEADVLQKTGLSQKALQNILKALKQSRKPLILAGGVSLSQKSGLETALLTALLQWVTGATQGEKPLVDFSRREGYDRVGTFQDMKDLAGILALDKVGVLFVSKTNPLAQLPSEYGFSSAFQKASFRVGLGDSLNETLAECDLLIPLSHPLECYGDTFSRAGIWTFMKPVLPARFNTKGEGDFLLSLLGLLSKDKNLPASYDEYLYEKWAKLVQEKGQKGLTKEFWTKGVLESPTKPLQVQFEKERTQGLFKKANDFQPKVLQGNTLVITPSIRDFDGRSSDLPLLREIPDPLTSISYGEWIGMAPELAKENDLEDGHEVELSLGKGSYKFPIRKIEGLAKNVMVFPFREKVASNLKEDPKSGEFIAFEEEVKLTKTGVLISLPILSGGKDPSGKDVLPKSYDPPKAKAKANGHGTGTGHKDHNGHGKQLKGRGNLMYPEIEYEGYKWAMSIDLEACNGCSACVAACYIENNVALSGAGEHLLGREMAWIRLEPYVIQEEEGQTTQFVPMVCQQCDNAPCEAVCPVLATVHSSDGLNLQVYNRCVGTRYCSNNCPYKVRRFNWFDWMGWPKEKVLIDRTLFGGLPLGDNSNPDVSVRMRGVMEKCTFCIQRIRKARDLAKDEDRLVKDGEFTTACAQTCPTGAITFGNILDKKSEVRKASEIKGAHRILDHELNTKPSVYYLGKKE